MENRQTSLHSASICFGADGWREVIGVEITLERLLWVAAAAVKELAFRAPEGLESWK